MSYLEEKTLSTRQWWAIGAVVLLHIFLGYFFYTGTAVKVLQTVMKEIETVQIEEAAPPPEEPPPPPPQLEDIPPYVPPPDVRIETAAPPPPTIQTQTQIATPEPPRVVQAPVAPPAPPAPPPEPKRVVTQAAPIARTFEVREDDYPAASLRAEEQGVTQVRVVVGTDGRVRSCEVTRSSGHSRLDTRACEIAQRRWRFRPATEDGQPVESTTTRSYRWQITDARR
ncbi:MAG: energy transducer TonB [Thermaurantiacus sp.]